MNEIAKTNIKTKLDKAIESEKIAINEVANSIGILPQYISMIRNEKTWDKVSKGAWESILNWINSGQTIKEYGKKHGKVCPEKHEPLQGTVISKIITEPVTHKKSDSKNNLTAPDLPEYLEEIETVRLKIALDMEINLFINGQKIQLR